MSERENLPAVNGAASSLVGDAAADKAVIEKAIGDPSGIYWRGDGKMDGRSVQQYYQDLVRGELAGADGALAPSSVVDLDVPRDVTGYDLAAAPGSASVRAEDRDIIDQFLPVALRAGMGQRRVQEALGFALTSSELTPQAFRTFARSRGWPDRMIDVCLNWHAQQKPARA